MNCRILNYQCKKRSPHFDPIFHFKSLQHKHPLVKVLLFDKHKNFKCFSCVKNIDTRKAIYYCTKCDFRLCQKCQAIETRGKPFQFLTSWHDHPLTFCKTKGIKKENEEKFFNTDGVEILKDDAFFFTCNHCGIEYPREKDSFYCTACDF